jgi:hypothetical protein
MIEEGKSKEKAKKVLERVVLSEESKRIADAWLDQIKPVLHEARVTRSDIINWCIRQRPEVLSSKEIDDLAKMFFDPIKMLQATIRKVKHMVANGEVVDLNAMVASQSTVAKASKSGRKAGRGRRKQASQDECLKSGLDDL